VDKAVSNTSSPLLYLHRIGALEWARTLFAEIWIPPAVVEELREGGRRGHDVPGPEHLEWIGVVEPGSVPSEWLALDLGAGELAAMALALENPDRIVLLDDALARRIGQAAGLKVWGTLRILLEAKAKGLTDSISPLLDRLQAAGMWISRDIRERIVILAGEHPKN
jgi:predicted nucleic acid-binding protein